MNNNSRPEPVRSSLFELWTFVKVTLAISPNSIWPLQEKKNGMENEKMEDSKGGFSGNSWHVGSVEKCSYLAVWKARYGCGRTDEVLSHYLWGDSTVHSMHFLRPLITISSSIFYLIYFYFFCQFCSFTNLFPVMSPWDDATIYVCFSDDRNVVTCMIQWSGNITWECGLWQNSSMTVMKSGPRCLGITKDYYTITDKTGCIFKMYLWWGQLALKMKYLFFCVWSLLPWKCMPFD